MNVYLDHNATTPLLDEARAAMIPFLADGFGNASSVHARGQAAAVAVDTARRRLAGLTGASPQEVLFTSSGTEAVVTGLLGAARAAGEGRVVVCADEHRAALDAADVLEAEGWPLTRVAPTTEGVIDAPLMAAAMTSDTVLVSMVHANNETGVIHDVAAVSALCRERGALLHVDAIQSAGKIPVIRDHLGADLLSLSSHKLGGPQGVGALILRAGTPLQPLIPGSQEKGLRGGTVNVAGVVGFGVAAEQAAIPGLGWTRVEELRNDLVRNLTSAVPEARLTAGGTNRLPNTAHFTFPGLGDDLVTDLDLAGFAVSAGSACSAGSQEPSHVLLAMGYDPAEARTAVRVSLSPITTREHIDGLVAALSEIAARRRIGTVGGNP